MSIRVTLSSSSISISSIVTGGEGGVEGTAHCCWRCCFKRLRRLRLDKQMIITPTICAEEQNDLFSFMQQKKMATGTTETRHSENFDT